MSTHKTLKEFEKIYEDTYPTILKYLISKCPNLDDVNDMIQEIYLDLYQILKKNKKINDKKAFILGIAKNKLKKYISLKGKSQTISIFQKKEDNEVFMEIDARYRYRNRLYQ